MTTRRKLLVSASAAAILLSISVLTFGTTFGLYSGAASQETNSFTSGTLTLSSTVTGACTVTGLAPGDSSSTCNLGFTYSGSLSAYLAVDVVVETQAGSGGTALYNPTGSNGLSVAVADNQATPVTYGVPTTSTSCPTGAPTGSTCYVADNELVSTSAVSGGTTDTVTTTVSLPAAAGNGYQGGAAQILLTAHAVQSAHNTLSCVATPTAGQTCTPSGTFAWS